MKSRARESRSPSEAVALNASLPRELRSWVDERVKRGGFGTASEYIRSLIRDDRERAGREDRLEREFIDRLRRGVATAEHDAGRRLTEAFDMLSFSFEMMRANTRRDHPSSSKVEIERRLEQWKTEDDSSNEVPGYIERSEKHLRRYLSGEP